MHSTPRRPEKKGRGLGRCIGAYRKGVYSVPRKEDGQHEWRAYVPHRGTQPTGQVAQNDLKRDPAAEARCQAGIAVVVDVGVDAGPTKLSAGAVKPPRNSICATHRAPACQAASVSRAARAIACEPQQGMLGRG
jgi:hypothetical protein